MAGIGDWDLETGGTLGVGAESTPVEYPRSDAKREGTYPKVEESTEGVDENDGGTA